MAEKSCSFNDWTISIDDRGSVSVYNNGILEPNSKASLRKIAGESGYALDPKWNTQTAGAKLLKFLGGSEIQKNKHCIDEANILGFKMYEFISAEDLSFDEWWLNESDEDAVEDYNNYVQGAIYDCQNDEISLNKLGKWLTDAPAGLYFTNPKGKAGLLKNYQTCFWWDGEKVRLVRNYEDFEW